MNPPQHATRTDSPALERGLAVLEYIISARAPVGFTALMERFEIPRASMVRMLASLRDLGYLEREAAGHRAGPRCQRLADSDPHARCTALAEPLLAQLMEQTGNTAALFGWDGTQHTCLAKAMHEAAVPMQRVGHHSQHEGGTPWGWIRLVQVGKAERDAALAAAQIRRRPVLASMTQYRHLGFCFDDQIVISGVRRLAAPIMYAEGLLACLALGGNPFTMPDARCAELGDRLRNAATELAAQLG